ncbi:hypothetical protein ABFS82_08G209100 [Erythranthe guttata]|uniref:Uncharacterized protein n=1 Tax=Erythranthe guttata TaxID=4155 RepID=A0A022QSA2_ERYGU|nr:PREDICTED: protein POLLENLESS 3-LIKE 2 [Erythranthe guttata]EYU30806.1 hypothetical protein MIMGU_mgv1a005876mg [Erythranthe guttata]|eukprot:XP_012845130.1 PREDICTED: protein POLLENLESS 3-LIKE 2 [Erythranthe guttata]
MMQEMWNGPPGFRPTKSAPCSPAKPLGVSRTRSDSFHVAHKVPVGDTPYVRAKNVQLVDKDPERAIPLFWSAINAGDRVDSALKDMAIVMKQQNRAEEAIEAIKSLRSRCSDQAQESLDNILLDLYKRCGRLDDQISLLKHKLYLIQQGMAFNGKRTKTARSQGKKFQVSVEQEATRLLGNLGWALMQQNNYIEAEEAYRRALLLAPDNNKMCNLGICLMKQGRIGEAKENLRRVKPAVSDGPRGVDSHLKAYERAQQMLRDLESEMMSRVGCDRVEQSKLFDAFLGSSAIWQPQPCKDQQHHHLTTTTTAAASKDDVFGDENVNSNNIAPTKNNNHHQLKKFGGGGAFPPPPPPSSMVNSLNIDAQPFFSAKFAKESSSSSSESLKRTRSGGNVANLEPENKMRKSSEGNWADLLLPDCDDFQDAIIAAVLGHDGDDVGLRQRSKVDKKRLRVFQDITPSLSPTV